MVKTPNVIPAEKSANAKFFLETSKSTAIETKKPSHVRYIKTGMDKGRIYFLLSESL